jgi:hypothetical protein
MRRRLLECFSCGRRFKVPQALFGHLRHCAHYRLKRKAKAKAEHQPSRPRQSTQNALKSGGDRTDAAAISKRGGRDSQEHLLLLLDISEIFPELKCKSLDHGTIARLFGSIRPRMMTPQQWMDLYWIIDECERDYEQMVMRLRLDRTILFRVYQRMLLVKQSWLTYLLAHFDKNTQSVCEEDNMNAPSAWDVEERMWNAIMTSIKKMLVAAH